MSLKEKVSITDINEVFTANFMRNKLLSEALTAVFEYGYDIGTYEHLPSIKRAEKEEKEGD